MKQAIKVFENRKIRAAWDEERKSWWLSVIDAIAALRNTDYDTARNYYKQIKHRRAKTKKTFTSRQLKLRCKDGKQRFTDVMLYKEIIQLIQSLPSSKARGLISLKKFIGNLAANTKPLAKIFNQACSQQSFNSHAFLQTTSVLRLL